MPQPLGVFSSEVKVFINTFSIMITTCEVYEASLKILNFDLVKSNQRFSDLIEMWKGVGLGTLLGKEIDKGIILLSIYQ